MSVPDYPLGQTLDFKFTTRAFATGIPTTLAGTPVIDIYEDNSLTQITAAETLTVDFDGVTGLNNLRIVATSGNGFESGKSYAAVISAGTVGGVSVVGEVVQQFSINRSPALRPTTAGRTLDVAADGAIEVVEQVENAQIIGPGAISSLSFQANAIVAGAIAASALNGKGDWNIGKTGYSISGTKTTLDALNDVSEAQVNAQADLALADYDGPTNAEMEARTLVAANYATAAAIAALNDITAAQVLAAGDIDGFSLEEACKLILAMAGKLSGAGTTQNVMRAADDSKARITATVDSIGNRTAVTFDATG